MTDLISRQDAIDAITNIDTTIIPFPKAREYVEIGFKNVINRLKKLPSAEPERKNGKWEVQPSTGEDRPFIWWKCSVCGQVIFSETERDRKEFHAFCGRCGADMRGEE